MLGAGTQSSPRVAGPPSTRPPGPLLPCFWLGFAPCAPRSLPAGTAEAPEGWGGRALLWAPHPDPPAAETRGITALQPLSSTHVCSARRNPAGVTLNLTLPARSTVAKVYIQGCDPKARSEGAWGAAGQGACGCMDRVPNPRSSKALPLRGTGIVCGRACLRVCEAKFLVLGAPVFSFTTPREAVPTLQCDARIKTATPG